MESQGGEKEYEHSVWEIYRKEWETAGPEKKSELNKRMNLWQALMKSGMSASQAYIQAMEQESNEPPIHEAIEEELDESLVYTAIQEESDYRVVEERSRKPLNAITKLFKRAGTGGFYVGYGTFAILFSIVQFAVPAITGLSMIGWAITLFLEGSILLGLLVLLIGTPIAILGLAYSLVML
ncbi:hypothetical protein ACFLUR_02735 [Chloroflexota bacterium]